MRPYKLYVHNPVRLFDWVTWVAYLIRWFYRKDYNHVVTVIEHYGRKYVIHAVAIGVIMEGYDLWESRGNRRVERAEYNCDYSDEELTKRAILSVGYDYDKTSYIHAIIYKLTGIWIGKTGEAAKEKRHCWENDAIIEGDEEFWLATPEMKTV